MVLPPRTLPLLIALLYPSLPDPCREPLENFVDKKVLDIFHNSIAEPTMSNRTRSHGKPKECTGAHSSAYLFEPAACRACRLLAHATVRDVCARHMWHPPLLRARSECSVG